jgi:hypothetical protein
MTDREKTEKPQFDAANPTRPADPASVEDIPTKDAAADEQVKGGMYSRPVMLSPKLEEQ